MAISGRQETYTLQAAADLSAKQYHIVRQSAANTTNLASLSTDSAIAGILQNTPSTNEFATVCDGGISKVVAGAAITQGLHISTNGSGRAIASSSGEMTIGRALEAAGADGDIISVRAYTPFRWSGAV